MIQWHTQRFDDLSPRQLYQLLQLRCQVFIVEQNCPFLDIDDKDFDSLHVWASRDNTPIAYCRIVPPQYRVNNVPEAVAIGSPSIGRVCTAQVARGTGIGVELMQQALRLIHAHWPQADCQIGAQSYLRKFYERLGFAINGDEYLEDGIPHLPMRAYATNVRSD